MVLNKTNPEHMKTYLQHVLAFEKLVYIWSNSLNTANRQVNQLSYQKENIGRELRTTTSVLSELDSKTNKEIQSMQEEIENCKKILKHKRRSSAIKILLFSSVWIISALLAFFKGGKLGAFAASLPFFVVLLLRWAFTANTVSDAEQARHVLANCEAEIKNNSAQNQARRKKLLLHEQVGELRNTYETATAHLAVAESKQARIAGCLQKAKTTLNEIYALNLLPSKYRSLSAVATLYEYLETGRCTVIQGHGGIYDTYEYDLKLGIIVSKLDEIIDRLDLIAENQRLLYAEMKEANRSLHNINSELVSFHNDFSSYAATSLELQRQENATIQWAAWNQWANGRT